METRYKIAWACLLPPVRLFLKLKFGYKYKMAKNLPDNYIVLSNHVTDFDPLFVGSSFSKQMFFVASEHTTRWGLASKLLKYFFNLLSPPHGGRCRRSGRRGFLIYAPDL